MNYNCKIMHYPNGTHVSFYLKNIQTGKKKSCYHLKKSDADKIRTVEQIEHCKKVSLSSTKRRVYNIARSNTWDWFLTLTFDRKITDSSNYLEVLHKLQEFLKNLRKRKCPELKYIIVPELHKDKTHYHFHGLLSGIDGMKIAYSGHNDKNGTPIFNVLDWKWGFSTVTRIKDTVKASAYVSKYITKDSQSFFPNRHRYLCSMNVNRTDAEYILMDETEFLSVHGMDISFAKSQVCPPAGQIINYYELDI